MNRTKRQDREASVLEVRLCRQRVDAVAGAGGVLLVSDVLSAAEATAAIRALCPDLDGHAIARAVAIAHGSPTATGAGRSPAHPPRHRAAAGTPTADRPGYAHAAAAGSSRSGAGRSGAGRSGAGRSDAGRSDAGRSGTRRVWRRRVRLLALTAAVLVIGPPVRQLDPGGTAAAAIPPARVKPPVPLASASPTGPVPHASVAARPQRRPAAHSPRPAAPPAAAPPVGSVPVPRATPAAPPPAPRVSRPAATRPPEPAVTTPPTTTAPPALPEPLPTVVGIACTLLPVPLPVCPSG